MARPEHITLGSNGLPVKIAVVEPTGAETQIFARAGDEVIDALLKNRVHVLPGETVFFQVDPRKAHIFDRETTARL